MAAVRQLKFSGAQDLPLNPKAQQDRQRLADEKGCNEPTHLGSSSYTDETDENEIKKKEGKPQKVVAAPAHPAVIQGQQDLIENVERDEQQTEPRDRKQISPVRRQQQRNKKISRQEIQKSSSQPDGNTDGSPIRFAFGIVGDFPCQDPVAAHQSEVAQNRWPQNDGCEFASGNGTQQSSGQDAGDGAASLDDQARGKCSEIGFGKYHAHLCGLCQIRVLIRTGAGVIRVVVH